MRLSSLALCCILMSMAPGLASLANTARGSADEPVTEDVVPRRIAFADSQKTVPLWVDARELSDPEAVDGIDWSLVEPEVRSTFERRFELARTMRVKEGLAADDCALYTTARQYDSVESPRDHSFAELAKYAQGIYRGTVKDSAQGLWDGSPGTIVRVATTETYRSWGEVQEHPYLLIFLPFAKFRMGAEVVCARDFGFPALPEVGEELLLFAFWPPPLDESDRLVAPAKRQLVIERTSGRLDFSPSLSADLDLLAADSLTELAGFLDEPQEN